MAVQDVVTGPFGPDSTPSISASIPWIAHFSIWSAGRVVRVLVRGGRGGGVGINPNCAKRSPHGSDLGAFAALLCSRQISMGVFWPGWAACHCARPGGPSGGTLMAVPGDCLVAVVCNVVGFPIGRPTIAIAGTGHHAAPPCGCSAASMSLRRNRTTRAPSR